jgi:hypothetical protein
MTDIASLLLVFLQESWSLLAGVLLMVAVLAGLAAVLRGTWAAALGDNRTVAEIFSASAGLVTLVVLAFSGVPALTQAAQVSIWQASSAAGCGPVAELGALASMAIGAVGALRMILAVVQAAVSSSFGSGSGIGSALITICEAALGMVLASAASPIAAHFLGAC